MDDKDNTETFSLDSDTVAILNTLDENPLCYNNTQRSSQSLYGGVSVTGGEILLVWYLEL